MEREARFSVDGHTLVLHHERAAFWEEGSTLFLADLHFGKAAGFRELSIPVPAGTTEENYRRLGRLQDRFRPERMVFLGDLWHAREGRTSEGLSRLQQWRSAYPGEVILIEGNHDRRAGSLPAVIGIREKCEGERLGPFALCHYPQEIPGAYVLAGHLHPGIRLEGKGRQSVKLPCFWFSPTCGVLPAFGEFTGTAAVNAGPEDSIFAIAEDQVVTIQLAQGGLACAR